MAVSKAIKVIKSLKAASNGNAQAMDVRLCEITPEFAMQLLELNTSNRKVNPARVRQYAAMMTRGAWRPGVADICVGSDGVLINGQHCLEAIVKSGVTVVVTLKSNMPPNDMQTIDTHRPRRASDTLQMWGFKNATTVAGSAPLVMAWRANGGVYPKTTGAGTASQTDIDRDLLLRYCLDHQDELSESAALAKSRYAKAPLIPAAHIAVLQIVFADFAPEIASEWMRQMFDEAEVAEQPVAALRSKLIQEQARRTAAGRWTPDVKDKMAVKSFNAFAAGREIKQFKLRRDEEIRIVVPDWLVAE